LTDGDPPTFAQLPAEFGRYEILELIGSGGSAHVYHAELRGPGGFRKRVALKLVRPDATIHNQPDETHMLVREARLGGLVRHPNVVDIYELGVWEGQPFISMEFVDGPSLRQVLADRGASPARFGLRMAIQIASGLAAAHDAEMSNQRMVHGDIKPENILIDSHGTAKISDFGLARVVEARRKQPLSKILGSPPYMSPEQLRGEPLDPRSDLFALGTVICEMLTGRRVFGGADAQDVYRQVLTVDPDRVMPAVSEAEAALPGVGTILRRCIQLRREDRPASATAVRRDLEALQADTVRSNELQQWLHGTPEPVDSVETFAIGPETAYDVRPARTAPEPAGAKHNLPARQDRFIGRSDAMKRIDALLNEGHTQVTVKGPPGIGKSRILQEVGWRWVESDTEDVWWVDLADARTAMDVAAAVASAAGLQLTKRDEADERLAELAQQLISQGNVLLLLDHADGIVGPVSHAIDVWSSTRSTIRVVVGTRERLRRRGERVIEIGPLSTEDAFALFVDRMVRARSTGLGSAEEGAAIQSLVVELDRMPLAIELAAARTSVITPEQLLTRLRDRFRILRTPFPAAARRHATLRRAIAWSWALLDEVERDSLAQLSVFRHGFSLEDAEAVIDLSPHAEAPWILDVVASLLDKSLLHTVETLGQPRFGLFRSIADFAAEQLAEMGPARVLETQQRHGQAFVGRIDAASDPRTLDEDVENLRVAFERAVARNDHAVAVPTGHFLAVRFHDLGPFQAAIEIRNTLLGLEGLDQREQIKQRIRVCWDRRFSGEETQVIEDGHRAMEMAKQAGFSNLEGQAAHLLANAHEQAGEFSQALIFFQTTLDLAADGTMGSLRMAALANMGRLQFHRCAFAEARMLLAEADQIAARIGADRDRAVIRNIRIPIDLLTRDVATVIAECEAGLASAIWKKDDVVRASLHGYLAEAHRAAGDLQRAWTEAERSRELRTALGDVGHLARVELILAELALDEDETAEARARIDMASKLLDGSGYLTPEAQRLMVLGHVQACEGDAENARQTLDAARERLDQYGPPVHLGRYFAHRGLAEWRMGNRGDAEAALAGGQTFFADHDHHPTSPLGQLLRTLEDRLG
jgi:serine/threonine protein kinase/predicted ATPase